MTTETAAPQPTKLDPTTKKKAMRHLATARLMAIQKMPYYATALRSLIPKALPHEAASIALKIEPANRQGLD